MRRQFAILLALLSVSLVGYSPRTAISPPTYTLELCGNLKSTNVYQGISLAQALNLYGQPYRVGAAFVAEQKLTRLDYDNAIVLIGTLVPGHDYAIVKCVGYRDRIARYINQRTSIR